MGLMDKAQSASVSGTGRSALPGSTSDIPATSALSLAEIAKAVATTSNAFDRASFFHDNERQVRVALGTALEALGAEARPDKHAASQILLVTSVLARYLREIEHSAEAAALIKPALDVPIIMSRPGAWKLVVQYASNAVGLGDLAAAATVVTKHAAIIGEGSAPEPDRRVVAHIAQIALALSEFSLNEGRVKDCEALAALVERVSWNPKDHDRVGWRGEARYLSGKAALAQDDYAGAVKSFREATEFQKSARKSNPAACDLPDMPSLLYFSELLVAQSNFRAHPQQLESWLEAHPIPPGAGSPPVYRLRADGFYGAGKLGQALSELEPALQNRSALEREVPVEAARILSTAAQIHDQMGETPEALRLFRDAAILFLKGGDKEQEVVCRRRHLEAAWELNMAEDGLSADDLVQAADELLDAADVHRGVSRDVVFGNLAKARGLYQQSAAAGRIEEAFTYAFAAAQALEQPDGPLYACHYELAMTLSEEGRFDEAGSHARNAREAYARFTNEPNADTVARIEGLIAQIAGLSGDMTAFRVSWRKVNALCAEGDDSGQAPIIADRLAAQYELLRDQENRGSQE